MDRWHDQALCCPTVARGWHALTHIYAGESLAPQEIAGALPASQGSAERIAVRNGHRTRVLSTTAGDLELRILKLRTGSFFPSLLERRRRVD